MVKEKNGGCVSLYSLLWEKHATSTRETHVRSCLCALPLSPLHSLAFLSGHNFSLKVNWKSNSFLEEWEKEGETAVWGRIRPQLSLISFYCSATQSPLTLLLLGPLSELQINFASSFGEPKMLHRSDRLTLITPCPNCPRILTWSEKNMHSLAVWVVYHTKIEKP